MHAMRAYVNQELAPNAQAPVARCQDWHATDLTLGTGHYLGRRRGDRGGSHAFS